MILEGNEQESIQQLDQPSPAKLSVILVNTMSSESVIMAIMDIVSVINGLYTQISYYIYIKSMVLQFEIIVNVLHHSLILLIARKLSKFFFINV